LQKSCQDKQRHKITPQSGWYWKPITRAENSDYFLNHNNYETYYAQLSTSKRNLLMKNNFYEVAFNIQDEQ